MRAYIKTFGQAIDVLTEYFEGDTTKTAEWLTTPNALLADQTPIQLVKQGDIDRLKSFISNALNGDKP